MNPRHHLDPSTLLGFSAGTLPVGFAAIVASHLDVCAECRAQLARADRVGGQLLAQLDGADLPPRVREHVLARLHASPQERATPFRADPVVPRAADALPAPLHPFFGERLDAVRWRRIGPGVHVARAARVDDSQLMLLRTAAGTSIPLHTHGGNELTMILQGAYDDCLGHFAPGDIADLDGEVEHQPVTAAGVPCICVAATDAPLRFRGWLARTLQPLFGL